MRTILSVLLSCLIALSSIIGSPLLIAPSLAAESPTASLDNLYPEHPRLYFHKEDFQKAKQRIQDNPLLKSWYSQLQTEATKIMAKQTVQYKITDARLLDRSREALRRIAILAGLYRLDGDVRKAQQARQEMLNVAAFPDWHPQHFLDTADILNGMAIGYDWLYDWLSPEDRKIIEDAIIEKGLKPAKALYGTKDGWWWTTDNNWNAACNAGILAGTLVIAQRSPKLAQELLNLSLSSIQRPFSKFGSNGSWEEGPMYWAVTTRNLVFYVSALQTALGSDYGLKSKPGFKETGFFRVHMTTPTGQLFNFADGDPIAYPAHQMFWLARTFREPIFQWHEYQRLKTSKNPELNIFHLLWADPSLTLKPPMPPLAAKFPGIHTVAFRNASHSMAEYIGFKGGNNRASHSHLDLGSFIFEADGVRWAVDLGSGDYNAPGYFGKLRFTYYSTRTLGHNTLTIEGANQEMDAIAPLTDYDVDSDTWLASVDLTKAYKTSLQSAKRSIQLVSGRRFMIRDTILPRRPLQVQWNMHTTAEVSISGAKAILVENGRRLQLDIFQPKGITFKVTRNVAQVLTPTGRRKVHRLSAVIPMQAKSSQIVVSLLPLRSQQ